MAEKKVSVIMGVYNCEDTIEEAINSILKQTYSNWELIICDDCSIDKTFQKVKKYSEMYPNKIKVLENKSNKKLAYSLNRCLDHSTGYYIARMDADDISKESRFEKQIAYLKKHTNIDLVGTAMQRFRENKFGENELADIIYCESDPDVNTLKKDTPFCHPTIMTYKYVYDALNGYTVSTRTNRGQDLDLWFRFFYKGFKGSNIMDPLYYFRENTGAIKRRNFNVRFNAFKTKVFGYNLLNYSPYWYLRSFIVLILKSLIPYKIISIYRYFQKVKFDLFNME